MRLALIYYRGEGFPQDYAEAAKWFLKGEVQRDLPGGVPEQTIRTVSENCRTLAFSYFGFEEK